MHIINTPSLVVFIGMWNNYGKAENKPKGIWGGHRDYSLHPGKINHN